LIVIAGTFSELVASLLLCCGTHRTYHMVEESHPGIRQSHSARSAHRMQLPLKPY